MSKVLTLEEFKEKLEKRINGRPLTVVAPELGVSFQFLSQVRHDVEWPGKKVAAALGYEEVRAYRPIRKPRAKAATEEKQHKPRRAGKKRKASAPHKATTARRRAAGPPADDTKRKQWREQKAKQRASRKKARTGQEEAATA